MQLGRAHVKRIINIEHKKSEKEDICPVLMGRHAAVVLPALQ